MIGFLSLFFSGELTKFNMFPKGETLHCLKVSNFVVCAVLRGDPSKEIVKPGFQLFNGLDVNLERSGQYYFKKEILFSIRFT